MADRHEHVDPRMGDEAENEQEPVLHSALAGTPSTLHVHPNRHVRLDTEPTSLSVNPDPGQKNLNIERGESNPSDATAATREKTLLEGERDEESGESRKPVGDRFRERRPLGQKLAHLLPFDTDLGWVSNNFTWSKIKPVIRCALVAWISLLFVIIPKLEIMLGQASFLILIAGVLMPPNNPFIAVVEQEVTLMLFAAMAWAWSCLGLFLANLTRNTIDSTATLDTIATGMFIEAAPSVIQCVFLFFGSTFFLYLKARLGPGPFLIPTILACICLDVCLCTASLYPFAFYKIGKAVVIPLAFHSAFAIFFSATVFPSTVTAQYTTTIRAVLEPIGAFLEGHRAILKLDPSSPEFAASIKTLRGHVNKSEGGLTAAGAWYRLLQRDVVYGRFAPADVGGLQWWIRRIVTRSDGMNIYFTVIEPTREKFPITPAATAPVTPARTREPSPVRSSRTSVAHPAEPEHPTMGHQTPDHAADSPRSAHFAQPDDEKDSIRRRRTRSGHTRGRERAHEHSPLHVALTRHIRDAFNNHGHKHKLSDIHDDHMHFSLLHLAHALTFPTFDHLHRFSDTYGSAGGEGAVGVYESQRYLELESTRLTFPNSPELTDQFTKLLGEACDELLETCVSGLESVQRWLAGVRNASWGNKRRVEARREERLKCMEIVKGELDAVIERFRQDKRLRVLDPYRCAFDPKHVRGAEGVLEAPPHKYLFHCYMYEYHTLQLATMICGMLGEIIRLEQERKTAKLWIPSFGNTFFFWWDRWSGLQDMDRDDDEDPDIVQFMEPDVEQDSDLGQTRPRDPDALPPSNLFEVIMHWLYQGTAALGGGNVLFAIKAGLLTVLLSLPYHIKKSAHFAYEQHLVWAIFIGQLTIARFRGDTTFGLVARIIATFFGGLLGTILWYISTGSGRGNPYGLAAVCAVTFPFIYYARLYWPAPPVSNLIFFVTALVVVGFSWQDTHFPAGFVYFGINVSWRRFVLVTAGVTAAFLASFLPPSTTLRGYQRRMMATTVAEMGSVYCSVVSFANTRSSDEVEKGPIVQSLIAIRLKLKRSLVLRANIVYEFSLRGRWPTERYQKILEIQLEIAYLLSHLMSVVERLEPAWRRAFLRRTRFLDADFQGDVLAVISMISTALRTGHPLPQITPCPLLDRYMQNQHGLNILRREADDHYGLPRTMTIDTLANEQYMCFSVGCTTAFGIVTRLDRLMVATKELVGEQYHIRGVGVSSYGLSSPLNDMRPAKDV